MKNKLVTFLSILALIGGALVISADAPAPVAPFSSTAASSVALKSLACPNTNGVTVTVVSAGGSSFTVQYSSDTTGSGAYKNVTGLVGVAASNNTQYYGSLAGTNAQYVLLSFTGNVGTFSGNITCTGTAPATGVISSLPPISGTVSNNCVSNCTPVPSTSVSPGLMVGVTHVGPSPGPQAGFSCGPATNCAAVDSNGHQAVNACSSTSNQCVTIITGTNSMMETGLVGIQKTELSAASGVCQLLSGTAAVIIVGVLYPAGTAQTGQLDFYDVNTAVCTGNYFYEQKARPSTATQALDPIGMKVTTGLAYQWTTTAEVGHVWLLTI